MSEVHFTQDVSPGFNAQLRCDIDQVPTEFVFHRFANRWFLLVTQYGRIPNLYTIKFDVKANDEQLKVAPVDHPEFHVSVPVTMKCNLGADKAEVRAGIQFLINKTKLGRCPTEILICLGLKQIDGDVLRAVAETLDKIIA